jgi:hypothetical protein
LFSRYGLEIVVGSASSLPSFTSYFAEQEFMGASKDRIPFPFNQQPWATSFP